MISILELPSGWSNAAQVDWALGRVVGMDALGLTRIEFRLHGGCKLWIDGVLRLMAHCNQMAGRGIHVRLTFLGGSSGVMGYIDRMGFFDHLDPRIETIPVRPAVSGASLFRGGNTGLVEIVPIVAAHRDDDLPNRLTEVLRQACAARADADRLSEAASTLFSELIGNVYDHTQTSGHVALQVYPGGSKVKVVVCDDGLGLMETLRPALNERTSEYRGMTDVELLVEMFRSGLSRHSDPKHGQGLKDCATKAVRFQAELDVRLVSQNVRLTPSRGGYEAATAYCSEGLPLLRGTHIAFTFGLAP
ncbi:ATP-binding protein [Methylobacterium aquaticum]|uniref:ATP-binding protein n=1 Tax=Methylobacterium aquaticum TaxID=270351 RepID=UPI0011AE669E|nr:ATP-binding protein [Methylobacterium aquaticum]